MENNEDDMIPLQYLKNENPFAFCKDYHKNSINLQEKKARLSALQKIQPQRIHFRMSQKRLDKERFTLIEAAVAHQRKALIMHGLSLLGIAYDENPEELFERHMGIPEILDIALELQKMKLIHHQRRLRSKVSAALSKKIPDDIEYKVNSKACLEIDNLKDALVYCNLEDLYYKRKGKEGTVAGREHSTVLDGAGAFGNLQNGANINKDREEE